MSRSISINYLSCRERETWLENKCNYQWRQAG